MPADAVVVGIDVSKARLDVAVVPGGRAFAVANDAAGRAELIKDLTGYPVTAVGLEASGGHEREVTRALRGAGLEVRVLHPSRVRAFARAVGQQAKTDRIGACPAAALWADRRAALIARCTGQLGGATQPLDPDRARLRELQAHRRTLLAQRHALACHLAQLEQAELRQGTSALLDQLDVALRATDRLLERELASPAVSAPAALLRSAPGVGPVLAATLLARLPELGRASAKQIAALAGVAPYDRQSGQRSHPRRIRGGRPDLRCVLYMAALGGVRANPALRRFYDRLRERGKPAKVALTAAMRKLLTILNAMRRKGEPWAAPATAGA